MKKCQPGTKVPNSNNKVDYIRTEGRSLFSGKKKKALLKSERLKKKDRADALEISEKAANDVNCLIMRPTLKQDSILRIVDVDKKSEIEKRRSLAREPISQDNVRKNALGISFADDYSLVYIDFPIRPPWNELMSVDQIDESESSYFQEYSRFVEKHYGSSVNAYEKNLETWRQLWRVLEKSDILLLLCDGRCPSFNFPASLYRYIKSIGKDLIIVLTKVDLLSEQFLKEWLEWFATQYPDVIVVPFSSHPMSDASTFSVCSDPRETMSVRGKHRKLRGTAIQKPSGQSNLERAVLNLASSKLGRHSVYFDPTHQISSKCFEVQLSVKPQLASSGKPFVKKKGEVAAMKLNHACKEGFAALDCSDSEGDRCYNNCSAEESDEEDEEEEEERNAAAAVRVSKHFSCDAGESGDSISLEQHSSSIDSNSDEKEQVENDADAEEDRDIDHYEEELRQRRNPILTCLVDNHTERPRSHSVEDKQSRKKIMPARSLHKRIICDPENSEASVVCQGEICNSFITLGILGFPNAGKSSFINSLARRKVVSVSKTPGHTKHLQTIFLNPSLRLCDCPGLVFPMIGTPYPMQVMFGLVNIAQVREVYSTIAFVAARVDLIKIYGLIDQILQLRSGNRTSITAADPAANYPLADYLKGAVSAYDIAEAWALKRSYYTSKMRLDAHRAGNEILRDIAAGRVLVLFAPPPPE
jgi:ribosome biogenesis GTPase A